MERGVFGIMPDPGGARFSDGQKWLDGSAPELVRMLDRDRLDGFFPVLADCAPRIAPDWSNREGAMHVLGRNQHWYLVHCFQPEFSISRSVPLWLCVRISREELAADMSLAAMLVDLERCRVGLDRDPMSVLRWIMSAPPTQGPAPGVDDLRMAASIHDALTPGQVLAAPGCAETPFWRGFQLLLEAWRELADDLWAVVRVERSGRVHLSGDRSPICLLEAGAGALPAAGAFESRRVADASLLEHLGLRQMLAQCVVGLPGTDARAFGSAVEVPAALLDIDELRDHEIDAWAKARWSRPAGAADAVSLLVRRLRSAEGDRARTIRLLSRLLVADPDLPGGGLPRAERLLRDAMEVA